VRVKLVFPESLIREPIVAGLVRDHGITPNIRQASIEDDFGWMVLDLDLDGDQAAVHRAVAWLHEIGVEVDQLGDVLES
jgi:ABC-type methionine transport system ATPase subunit